MALHRCPPGIQVGLHAGWVVIQREASSPGAPGEQDLVLVVRIKGELEGDGT